MYVTWKLNHHRIGAAQSATPLEAVPAPHRACEECRAKKLRCDGAKPACARRKALDGGTLGEGSNPGESLHQDAQGVPARKDIWEDDVMSADTFDDAASSQRISYSPTPDELTVLHTHHFAMPGWETGSWPVSSVLDSPEWTTMLADPDPGTYSAESDCSLHGTSPITPRHSAILNQKGTQRVRCQCLSHMVTLLEELQSSEAADQKPDIALSTIKRSLRHTMDVLDCAECTSQQPNIRLVMYLATRLTSLFQKGISLLELKESHEDPVMSIGEYHIDSNAELHIIVHGLASYVAECVGQVLERIGRLAIVKGQQPLGRRLEEIQHRLSEIRSELHN